MANINDKIQDVRNAARPNTTTVASGRSAGGTTLSCASLTGWPTASAVSFVTYQIDANSDPVAGTQCDWKGIRSGNDIGSLTLVDGTDVGNSIGDVVEMLPTAGWGQDLADALTEEHNRSGTHSDITADSINVGATDTDTLVVNTGTTLPAGDIGTADIADAAVTSEKMNATIACRVYRDAALTIGGGAESLLFDTKNFDLGNNFNTSTGIFTAPVTGYYMVSVTAAATDVDIDGQLVVYIFVNGAAYAVGTTYAPASTSDPRTTATSLVPATAGQAIEGYVDCSSTEALNPGTLDTYMSIYFVGV